MAKKVMASEVIQPNLFNDTINSADALIEKLAELNTEFKKTAEVSKEVIKNSKFDSVKSMNDLVKATENATKTQKLQLQVENELNKALKLKTELQEKLNKSELVAEKVNNEKLRGTILQTKEDERQAKATERKIIAETRLQSAYNRVNTWLGKLRNEYRDLAVRKELGAQLTEKESTRYANLEKRIQTYDAALKKVDGTMGIHNRNVGNYASGWNGLGNSINQLSREMPAFANSVSTGFMAISNNLPMLFDELQKIKKANVELKAQGIETRSALSQVGSAIFSWGTALSVGVTLLTLFGAKMVDWIENALNPANKELLKQEETQKRIAKTQNEKAQFIGKETNMYLSLIYALKQTNKNSLERKELIDTINKQYGTTLKNIQDETKFQLQLNTASREWIELKDYEFEISKKQERFAIVQEKEYKARLRIKEIDKDIADNLKEINQLDKNNWDYSDQVFKLDVKRINLVNEQVKQQEYLEYAERRKLVLSNSTLELDKKIKEIREKGLVPLEDKTLKKGEVKIRQQKELNEYVSKYAEIIAKITKQQGENGQNTIEQQLADELQKQLDNISQIGDGEIQELQRILAEEKKIREQSIIDNYNASEIARKKEYENNRKDLIEKENSNVKDLEQKRDTFKKGEKDYIFYQEQIKKVHIFYKEQIKKIDEDYQLEGIYQYNEYTDELNKANQESAKLEKETMDKLSKEYFDYHQKVFDDAKKKQEDEAKLKAEKFDKYAKLAKASADLFIFLSNKKVKATENEISALQKQQDFLQNLAVNGNILAQQSLAQNEKLQAEANKKKEKELKKQENIKIASTVFEAYAKNAGDKDVKNPVIKTISDVSILQAFIQSLATFYEGTETTVGDALGMPQLQGKDGYIVRVDKDEKILNPSLSAKTGNLTTKEIAQISEDRLRGKLMYKGETMQTNVGFENILLLNEITELKEIIKSKPEMNIQMGEIVGGVMHLVESTKVRNTTTRNIHRFNNKI